jgi:hypothetical protein
MATVNRADTAVSLQLSGAWNGGSGPAPTSSDVATWGSPNITTNVSVGLGAAVFWGGISLLSSQTSNISLGVNTQTITLGSSGIDMSNAAANLTLGTNPVALNADQSWIVGANRTLTAATAISGNIKNLTLAGSGIKTLSGASTGWTNSTITIANGIVTSSNNNSLGAASNAVIVSSGAALQVSAAAPAQTSWSVSGVGTAASYGAFWTSGAFGAGKTITAKAQNTVLSFRSGIAFTGIIVLDTGINTLTLNGESNTAANDNNFYTITTQSSYSGAVTLQSFALDGTTFRSVKYSIGSGATVTDANTSGGGGLGGNANSITVDTTGGIHTGATSTATFNRNYTFIARGARQAYNQFKYTTTGTTTFNGTLSFPGSTSDYVQFGCSNNTASIVKFNGTITGNANVDVGSNGSNGNVDGTLELGSSLVSSGWTASAGLTVNNIRYGGTLSNANPITFLPGVVIDNVSGAPLTVRHSAYSQTGVSTFTFTGTNDLTMTGPVASSADFTGAPATWTTNANTLFLDFNFTGSNTFTKSGTATLALSGNNTGFTGVTLTAGTLVLNSAGSAGPSAANFVFAATGTTLDSTTGATLTQAGGINLGSGNGGFTWKGTADLSMGSGNVTHGGSRTVTFVNGATGMLTFAGPLITTTLTYLWNIGGGQAGAKNVLYIANTNASLATTGQVTAGYLRAGNAASLGAVGTLTTWTVSSSAAIELIGSITVPSSKSFAGLGAGSGPNTDGALRSVSGANNKWQGAISFAAATGARIQVDAGTFTLDPTGSTAYVGIDGPATPNTAPIVFSAASGATLNQDRILAAGFSTVAIANGSGTVVLSKANQHAGAMTCSAGTTKLTNVNAAGTNVGNNVTVTAGATMESAVKAVFPATLTLGSTSTPATFKISA